MFQLLRLSCFLFLSILLFSCASTDKPSVDDSLTKAVSYKYEAWRLDDAQEFEAINVLLDEVDELIENRRFDAATDKLERVLRIRAEYAPAWSRLSWIALQTDFPQRSIEMAKRSNSFAHSDTPLQLLNWHFISDASQMLNDGELHLRARQKIDSLSAL